MVNEQLCSNRTFQTFFVICLIQFNQSSIRLQRFLKEILYSTFQCKSPEPVSIPSPHVVLLFIYLFIYLLGGSHSTPALLYKYLQHVYFDPSRARFYNLSVKGGTHFIFTIYVFSYVFTAFVFILHIFYFIFYLLLDFMRV